MMSMPGRIKSRGIAKRAGPIGFKYPNKCNASEGELSRYIACLASKRIEICSVILERRHDYFFLRRGPVPPVDAVVFRVSFSVVAG